MDLNQNNSLFCWWNVRYIGIVRKMSDNLFFVRFRSLVSWSLAMRFLHLSWHLYIIRIRYGDDVIIGDGNRLRSIGMWTEEKPFCRCMKTINIDSKLRLNILRVATPAYLFSFSWENKRRQLIVRLYGFLPVDDRIGVKSLNHSLSFSEPRAGSNSRIIGPESGEWSHLGPTVLSSRILFLEKFDYAPMSSIKNRFQDEKTFKFVKNLIWPRANWNTTISKRG